MEELAQKKENCEECRRSLKSFLRSIIYLFDPQGKMMAKNEAYESATYGNCETRQKFIANRQKFINGRIRDKVSHVDFGDNDYEKYFLLLSFDKVEESCAEEIFKPFVESGYSVTKISDQLEVLNGTNVYLIDWKER